MTITLVNIAGGARKERATAESTLVDEYRRRAALYTPCVLRTHDDEAEMLAWLDKQRKRQAARLVLLDSSGEMLRSEGLAVNLRKFRDGAVQQVVVAVGPADGWSRDTLAQADRVLSLGRMTLPHRLAQVVIAEQIYRALTILAGHPYHCGH